MLTTGLSLVSLAATTWLQKACQSARVTFSSHFSFGTWIKMASYKL